jgi:hypothetical protein
MATLHQLKSEANKIGAVVCINDYDEYERQMIEVESPDGFKWSESNTQVIHTFRFRYIKDSTGEACADLMHRMAFGLEPLTEEDE